MNAQALYEIVKDWPREAWPENISFGEPPYCQQARFCRVDNGNTIALAHAVLMFEASGMRWLLNKAVIVEAYAMDGAGRTTIKVSGSGARQQNKRLEGPTPLHAISAAIREVK